MASVVAVKELQGVINRVYGGRAGTPSAAAPWTPRPLPHGHRGRYLWSDAFGVVNFITLWRETGEAVYLDQAKALVGAVHDTLGYTRDGRHRLSPLASADRPLLGGLRIGKVDASGSDGDGQYFHYLTKHAFALNRLSVATGEPRWNDWAVDLCAATFPRFLHHHGGHPHLYWKISTDMSCPLVTSEGNLDPYDGLVTYRLVQQQHAELHGTGGGGSSSGPQPQPQTPHVREQDQERG
jgi:hypothetical protein